MIRVNVVVEGQAEETFVKESLAKYLGGLDVGLTPRRVEFGRKKGRIYRGGLIEYAKLKKDVTNWLKQDADAQVTTMVDLYALPPEFPGRAEAARIIDPFDRVAFLEAAFAADIGSSRFIPYIQLHEFEALVFTRIEKLADYYPDHTAGVEKLVAVAAKYATPELINDGRTTAPSKRILAEIKGYDKVIAGSLVTLDAELPSIRQRCPHFNEWVGKLEKLGGQAG